MNFEDLNINFIVSSDANIYSLFYKTNFSMQFFRLDVKELQFLTAFKIVLQKGP